MCYKPENPLMGPTGPRGRTGTTGPSGSGGDGLFAQAEFIQAGPSVKIPLLVQSGVYQIIFGMSGALQTPNNIGVTLYYNGVSSGMLSETFADSASVSYLTERTIYASFANPTTISLYNGVNTAFINFAYIVINKVG